jgi:hypothetical protein
MGLFSTEDDRVAKLEAEIAFLKSRVEGDTKPSRKEERQGFSPNDPARTWAEWQAWKKINGKAAFNNPKVQTQVMRDSSILGKEKFFGGNE